MSGLLVARKNVKKKLATNSCEIYGAFAYLRVIAERALVPGLDKLYFIAVQGVYSKSASSIFYYQKLQSEPNNF